MQWSERAGSEATKSIATLPIPGRDAIPSQNSCYFLHGKSRLRAVGDPRAVKNEGARRSDTPYFSRSL